ncbi:hypothetical protein SAMN05421503_1450 [Terribacillus aidingensis]|uniref:KTSC domain-containing protein n=1 Tax=Terribacillus aidingensis TaxID=586416 RepID=A0A285NKD5_9BACI|nr:hypothetical protein SAMN05421503_1450 [Terribacillus aidingensis]
MRYELVSVVRDMGERVITFRDTNTDREYIYYLTEIRHVRLPYFKSFILPLLADIRSGKYDTIDPI